MKNIRQILKSTLPLLIGTALFIGLTVFFFSEPETPATPEPEEGDLVVGDTVRTLPVFTTTSTDSSGLAITESATPRQVGLPLYLGAAATTTDLTITNVTSCSEALETDSLGRIVCGTDATGGGGGGSSAWELLFANTITPTTSSAGIFVNASSTFDSQLRVNGNLFASSTVIVDGGITGDSLTLTTDLTVANGGTGASTLTGLLVGNGTSAFTAIAGTTCTNQFLRAFTSSGGTCASINNGDWSGTDLSVSNGGTGASTLTDGGVLLGSGTGAITAMSVLANGSIIVGDGTTDPVALAAFESSTGDLAVTAGGTGVSSLTDGGVLVGSGTADVTVLSVGTNGQLLVGSTGADPVFATLNCDSNLTCTTGAGTLEIDLDSTISVTSATTTNLAITGYTSCGALETNSSGTVICGTDDTGASAGAAWNQLFTNAITPTNTSAGIFVKASSTIDANLKVSGNATTSGFLIVGTTNPVANLAAGTLAVGVGGSGTPSLTFAGDTDTGFSRSSSGIISVQSNGSTWVQFNTNGLHVSNNITVSAETDASSPHYTFLGDTDTGFGSLAAGDILMGITGGQARMLLGNSSSTITTTLQISGNASTTGYLVVGANPTINLSAGDLWVARATTTSLAVSSLSQSSCDVKALTNGSLYCGTDATGAGGSYPFTDTTNYGQQVSATTTAIWVNDSPFSFFASSTMVVEYASTTKDLEVGGNFYADANDGGSLGISGVGFSDLFLASGAVINFAAGDVTLTHSSDKVLWEGGHLQVEGPDGFDATDEEASLILGDGNAGISAVYGGGVRIGVFGSGAGGTIGANSLDAITIAETTGNVTFAGGIVFDSQTFDSLTDDATLSNNSGDLQVVDVTCTDCLNATEIEDIYLLLAGDTSSGDYVWFGYHNFSGASLEVPNGTLLSLGAAGTIGLDTTSNNFVFASSTTGSGIVIGGATTTLYSFSIPSTSADFISGGIIDIPSHFLPQVVTGVMCHVDSGTSAQFFVSDGTNDGSTFTCTTTRNQYSNTANQTFTAYEAIRVEIGTISGTPDYLIIRILGYRPTD